MPLSLGTGVTHLSFTAKQTGPIGGPYWLASREITLGKGHTKGDSSSSTLHNELNAFCSAKMRHHPESPPTGLEFHPLGTGVPSPWDWSRSHKRVQGTRGAFFLVVKLKCVTPLSWDFGRSLRPYNCVSLWKEILVTNGTILNRSR